MEENFALPLEISMEIANLERSIGHMETDLSFHQSQVHLIEENVRKDQKRLHDMRISTQQYFDQHSRFHSHSDERGEDHEM